jgi:hypothetical protein
MDRETSGISRRSEGASKSWGKTLWDGLNEIVKSPLFVFLVGSSFLTFYPVIRPYLMSEQELKAQQVETAARADAALVAPFLASLNTNEPKRFQAARAALRVLEVATQTGEKGEGNRIFKAVNVAIDTAAEQVYHPPEKTILTPKQVQKIDRATEAPRVPLGLDALYASLQSSIVYIQIEINKKEKQSMADTIRNTLRKNSVLAPGIERLENSKIPKNTQVRYFNDSDLSKANNLAAIVQKITSAKVYTVNPGLKATEGTLELWLGKNQQ